MKRKLKVLLTASVLTVSMLSMTGCGSKDDGSVGNLSATDVDTAKKMASEYISSFTSMTDDQLDGWMNYDADSLTSLASMSGSDYNVDADTLKVYANASDSWKTLKSDLSFAEDGSADVTAAVGDQTVSDKDGEITVVSDVTYSDGNGAQQDGSATVVLSENNANLLSASFDKSSSMGSLMEKAALNTLMGVGTVFLILLFLSFLISQMHHIPALVESFGKKKETPEPVAAQPARVVIPVEEVEEDETDDLELVAVISAAIAASEGTSADGFVVRSIKRRNRNYGR